MIKKTRLAGLLTVIFTFFVLVATSPMEAQKKPTLLGKVKFQTISGYQKALTNAEIQLLAVAKDNKPGKVLYRAYSSSDGSFIFYGVARGKYFLKVIQNREEFFQMHGNQKVKTIPIQISDVSKTKKLPIIIVMR